MPKQISVKRYFIVSVNFNLTIIQNFMQKSKLIDVKFVLLTPVSRKPNASAGDFLYTPLTEFILGEDCNTICNS